MIPAPGNKSGRAVRIKARFISYPPTPERKIHSELISSFIGMVCPDASGINKRKVFAMLGLHAEIFLFFQRYWHKK
jgi:hypothetical protein